MRAEQNNSSKGQIRVEVAGCRALFGPTHPETLGDATNLRNIMLNMGDLAGAEALEAEYPGIKR